MKMMGIWMNTGLQSVHTSVTGHEDWTIRYNKDGEPGNVYTINQSRKFTNLIPGHFYTFY